MIFFTFCIVDFVEQFVQTSYAKHVMVNFPQHSLRSKSELLNFARWCHFVLWIW